MIECIIPRACALHLPQDLVVNFPALMNIGSTVVIGILALDLLGCYNEVAVHESRQ